MSHASNMRAFMAAADSIHPLIQAYCGLVSVELVLKQRVELTDHNVCAGLTRLRTVLCVGNRSWSATAMLGITDRLKNDLIAIQTNGKDGLPRSVPYESYPYLRYSRFEADGWPAPNPPAPARTLLSTPVHCGS